MKMKWLGMLMLPAFISCNKNVAPQKDAPKNASTNQLQTMSVMGTQTPPYFFPAGADVGWLSQMESRGLLFYNKSGAADDCLQILKDQGVNSIRLRVWVNPSAGFCNKADVVALAIRAHAKGFHLMIDFHYSDTWADLNWNQTKPAAWASHTFSQLLTDVYDHTYEVLDSLKDNGIYPDWVQVGNEIIHGMLFPDGSTSNYSKLSQLINSGYNAVKAVSPAIQVIVHPGSADGSLTVFCDSLQAKGTSYDILGLSYYPYYNSHTYTQDNAGLQTSMTNLATRFGRPVMVVETGTDYTQPAPGYKGLNDLFNRVARVPNGNGAGVFYWEPEGYFSFSKYKLNAWDDSTKQPSQIMDAYLHNPGLNVVTNYDFETGSAQSGTITGWTTSTNVSGSVYTETGGYTGTYRLTHWRSVGYQATSSQTIAVANGTYKLTAWVQRGGTQPTCQLFAKDFGGSQMNYTIPVTSGWTEVTIDSIPVTNGSITIGFYSNANAGNWASIDNVHLQAQ